MLTDNNGTKPKHEKISIKIDFLIIVKLILKFVAKILQTNKSNIFFIVFIALF